MELSKNQIWIADFGSQYTQLITRRCRELGYSSCIFTIKQIRELTQSGVEPKALILSGGPNSVFEDEDEYAFLFENPKRPILGICFGMQLIGQYFKGSVEKGVSGEYGHAQVKCTAESPLPGLPASARVWMSHFDHISKIPAGFHSLFESDNGYLAGLIAEDKPIMGLQFHPEVEHTEHGKEILNSFITGVAKLKPDWDSHEMLEQALDLVKGVEGKKVLCAFSGGVDSVVAATLSAKILGENLHCFFVDNGLLRPQDLKHIATLQAESGLNIQIIDAKRIFLDKLKGVTEPEKKRKIIGETFIQVFESKVHEYERDKKIKFDYLLQGTLYPDVIESISPHGEDGKSATIKSHHNVGGLPERMQLDLLEPLRYLFKDEVRSLGRELKLPDGWVMRHPFPGPGIGVRVLGELVEERILKVQQSDQILFEELTGQNHYADTWQAFTVLLPVKTVGVKGDARAYEEVICLRMVNSTDGMTASFSRMPFDFLAKVSSRITNEVSGITRVVYDITSKPPGTIEWE